MSNSEMVLVPRALLGAVASALDTGNPAQKTLESVRELYLSEGCEDQPGAAEVTLRAIASKIGLDLSGPLPDGELSTVIINAISGGADDFPDTSELQAAGKHTSSADWALEGQSAFVNKTAQVPLSHELVKLESDIPPHQLRVLEELAQLTDRLDKLTAFFDTEVYRSLDVDERGRLKEQCALMGELQRVLAERVAAF